MRTAVAAPAQEPEFEELFAVLDRMTLRELAAFCYRLRCLTVARHVPETCPCGVRGHHEDAA